MKTQKLSIVVPVYNELKSIEQLIIRIGDTMEIAAIPYELIFVDDNSTDGTFEYLQRYTISDNIHVLLKKGKKGKAYSLLEGFAIAKGEVVAMIDADLQYPPEVLPKMIEALQKADIVVGNRKDYNGSKLRQFFSKGFQKTFGSILFGIHTDIQSGLKVFKKEVIDTISFVPSSKWAFDLEFLHRSKEAGFVITDIPIVFSPRGNGSSKVSLFSTISEIGGNAIKLRSKRIQPLVIPPMKDSMRGAGVGYKRKKYITHTTLHHKYSALKTVTLLQQTCIILFLAAFIIAFVRFPFPTAIVAIAVLSTIYFIDVLFNFFIILKSLHHPSEIRISDDEVAEIEDRLLPTYTILCPLYKEAHIIPHFLESISKLDWPKKKLDVILLLEEDDPDAKTVVASSLPSYVRAVIVPHSMPKTKPKACNYGLTLAKGDYLVIYDAEDMPESDQLKKAYKAFQDLPKNVVCLQAKLNYYNPHQNLLTRFFTAEYSLWFDVTLTGLQSLNSTIPLGGTSNHFRTKDLLELQGWDPFNVTEDADLGIRLFQKGYKTAIIESTTLEEANSSYKNWLRQRSRWIKGYMQTYLVHTRSTFKFAREQGWHSLVFHLVVGGKIAFILINPILWIATISYFALYSIVGPTIESLYPPVIFYMAATSLAFGNFLFLYYYMIGCAKRGHWSLMKYVFFVPFYWIMISIAGSIALYQLIFKPHYWEKTIHGLHLKQEVKKIIPRAVVVAEEQEAVTVFPGSFQQRLMARIVLNKKLFGGAFLILATMISNVGNLFFSTYFGRILDSSVLAILAMVGSFWSIAAILLNATGSTTNYRTGFLDGRYGKEAASAFWSYIRNRTWKIAGLISIAWLLLSPFMLSYFQTENILPFLSFIPVWLVGFAYFVDHGYLSGRLMFGTLGVIVLFETAVKIVLGLFFSTIDQSYVYLALPLSFLLSFLLGWVLVRRTVRMPNKEHKADSRHFPKKFFFVSMLTGLSTMAFLTLDFILAKHYLSPEQAGQYALLATVGKMVFFLGTLANQFILSIVSRDEGAHHNSKRTFYLVLAATFLLSGIGFIVFGVFGSVILTKPFLFGDKIVPVLPFLIPFSFSMLCFTASRAFTSYYLAKRMYIFPLVACLLSILQFVLISLAHESIGMIVASMVIVGGLNLVLMIIMHLFEQQIKVIENNLIDFFTLFSKEEKMDARGGIRILVLNWRDTKHVWAGGAEVYIHEISKRWVKDGNRVTVFCGNDAKHPRSQTIDGVKIIRRGGFYTVYFWAFIYYIVRFRGKFDVIVDCENGIPFFSPLYAGIPVVLLIHHIHQNVFREHLSFPLSHIARFAEGKLMPIAYRNGTVVTVSESSRKEIVKIGLAKDKNIHIVHNGINHKDFGLMRKSAYPLFSYVGRLKHYKNIDIAIKGFAQIYAMHNDAKLVIVGEGEAYNSLHKLVEKLGIVKAVTFTGKVSDPLKAKMLATSWAMIQPSMVEGWGITVIEANASGTPVIASNVPGLRDSIIDGKTGKLVELGNVNGFAAAMEEIIKSQRIRNTFAKEAFGWSSHFDWNQSADKFFQIILSLQQKQGFKVQTKMAVFSK